MTRILVVDDESALVELVRSYLEREQYEVLTAADGHSALDLARAAQPDLVVLDVMLPVLDGIEVCRQLRQFSDAYVIMLTARNEEIDKILGLTIDEAQHEVKLHEQPIELTAREFALLLALAHHPGRVFTRPQLLERVWGDAYYDEHVVDVHIANLRKKLEADPAHPHYLETVRGVGYRFRRRREIGRASL